MSNPTEVAGAIAQAVEPPATNPAASASPESDEAAKYKARVSALETDINKIKSAKDKEIEAERRARQEAEQRAEAAYQLAQQNEALAIQNYEKYAPEEEVAKFKTQRENDERKRLEFERGWLIWEKSVLDKAMELGEDYATAKALSRTIKTTDALAAYVSKKTAEKNSVTNEAEIEARILAKLEASGKLAAPAKTPVTPVDSALQANVATAKITEAQVNRAERDWRMERNIPKKKALRDKFEQLSNDYAKQNE